MISPKLKRNVYRILPFGMIWLVFGIIFLIVEYAATKDYNYTPAGVINLDFWVLFFALFAVTVVGLLIGIIELLFIDRFFARRSFKIKILGKLIIYSLFLFLIICITYPIAASLELKENILSTKVWSKFYDYLKSVTFLSTGFQMAISLTFTLFYNEISEKIGSGSFINFIKGKYHKPKIENRVFMFLDMRSSTSIAEKIGHVEYFELLKEYYHILSIAVIEYSGEIYQYVGDEIVITWNLSKGIKNNNCIKCFFKMKSDLKERQYWFEQKFGVYPEFKAGLHLGEVTTGEIGRIKKDIIFTGDVLNTTARIQSLCNDLQVDNLISKDLISNLRLETNFLIETIGTIALKGKLASIELFTIKDSTSC